MSACSYHSLGIRKMRKGARNVYRIRIVGVIFVVKCTFTIRGGMVVRIIPHVGPDISPSWAMPLRTIKKTRANWISICVVHVFVI